MIENIPFEKDVKKLRSSTRRFLRFHEILLDGDEDYKTVYDRAADSIVRSFYNIGYNYNLADTSNAFVRAKELVQSECDTKQAFKRSVIELAKLNSILSLHNFIFWNSGNLDEFYLNRESLNFYLEPNITLINKDEIVQRTVVAVINDDGEKIYDARTAGLEEQRKTYESIADECIYVGTGLSYELDLGISEGDYYLLIENEEGVLIDKIEGGEVNKNEQLSVINHLQKEIYDSPVIGSRDRFTLLKDDSVLIKLFEGLKEHKFISKSARVENFLSMFDEDVPLMRTRWIDKENLLGFLIQYLEQKNFIGNNKLWELTEASFLDKKGNRLTSIQQATSSLVLRLKGSNATELRKAKHRIEILKEIVKSC